ncbi:MAG: hypothetical protein HZB13_15960 [Acidobacteria bacterium]|nr:hypothetical protein [Acidobacteriota bacterium]
MDEPGQRLKQARERLGLRYRDVEELSLQIAEWRRNGEFTVPLSRLADIENRGVVPALFKLYSLCAIYRLDLAEVMRWYGVDPGDLVSDSRALVPERTHIYGFGRKPLGRVHTGGVQIPLSLDPGLDLNKTTFLSRFIQSWGMLPLMLVAGMDPSNYQYAHVGLDDWFMYPLIEPGSLLLIDEKKTQVASSGWKSEYDRPLYLLEHREGWLCAWCSMSGETLIAQPHPASGEVPMVFANPAEVEVIGLVVGVASRRDRPRRRRIRS